MYPNSSGKSKNGETVSTFLLYHLKSGPTGRDLARALGIPAGRHMPRRRSGDFKQVIRWGNTEFVPAIYCQNGSYGYRREINCRTPVALASSKLRALKTMQAAGVPVPKFSTTGEGLKFPLFGRSYRHCRGQDIRLIRDEFELRTRAPSDYYTEYIEPYKEYRIHVFHGQIIIPQKKYFSEGYLAEKENSEEIWADAQLIRNDEHGWRFYEMKDVNNVPEAVRNASISAVDALGLDFGAVDVISYGRDENGKRRASVLEVNTAPGLMNANLNIYADNLRSYAGIPA